MLFTVAGTYHWVVMFKVSFHAATIVTLYHLLFSRVRDDPNSNPTLLSSILRTDFLGLFFLFLSKFFFWKPKWKYFCIMNTFRWTCATPPHHTTPPHSSTWFKTRYFKWKRWQKKCYFIKKSANLWKILIHDVKNLFILLFIYFYLYILKSFFFILHY